MIHNIKNIFEIFYYFLGGIGLLLAGIGAIIASGAWRSSIEEKRINVLIKELKSKYPIENLEETFELIKSSAPPVYVLDKKTNIKHWITSPTILYGAGYNYSMVKIIEQEKVNSYVDGNRF